MKLSGSDRNAILAIFGGEVPARLERIAQALGKLVVGDGPDAMREHLGVLASDAHNLRGAAATVQLPRIEALAADLEREAEGLLSSGSADTAQLVRSATRLVAQLQRAAVRLSSDHAVPGGNAAGQAHEGEGPVVLHIEDNLSNMKLVERILARRPGLRLVEAQSGEEGVELAEQLRPALVLLDLRLPDMPGEEVLRRLRAHPATRALQVVVISAEARPAEATRLLELGADDYLVKPFEVEALLELVDCVLTGADV